VSHELAHIRCRDNLKKALLCLCVFPGMSKIERAWTEAAEMAADNAAVSSEREALDLASALIKISRLAPVARTPELAMSLVPDSSSVGDRVQRLLAWKEPNATRQCKRGLCAGISLTILAAALATITYPPALGYMHTLTEMLIR